MRRYHQLPYHKQVFHVPKAFGKTKEDWQIFENTHPAIIDRETFELVQELRQHRRRPTKSEIMSMFSDLLYCADCGEKLYYSVTDNYKREQAYFFCSAYRKNSNVCSAHYIWEKIVEHLVFESMQRILWYVQSYEKPFAQRQLAEFGEKQKKELSENAKIRTEGLQRFIDKAKQVSRLEALTPKLVHEFIEES